MNAVQTCLWLNNQAEEMAVFYTAVFPKSKIVRKIPYGMAAAEASGQREGTTMTVEFELAGSSFLALNGGPHFKIDPSISFFVGCDSEVEIDALWKKLNVLTRMELQPYPFAKKYGWCEDRFGVNWQLMLGPTKQKISPALLFANKKYGKASEAIEFYTTAISNSNVESIAHDKQTKAVLHSRFTLGGQGFVIMEGPLEHQFDFSPAISFILGCESQKEIDEIWSKLSFVPEAEQCAWLCDKYGVSWQVVHKDWGKMLGDADPEGRERLISAILKMKKPDLADLEKAARG